MPSHCCNPKERSHRADQVCRFQLQKISLKDSNVYAIEKVQKHLIQKFAFFHNWFRQRLHGAVKERMGRGQNKRKYAKLYFLHAQMGITPKQAHSLAFFFFFFLLPFFIRALSIVQDQQAPEPVADQVLLQNTLHHRAWWPLLGVCSLYPEGNPPHQCCHFPALLGSINTGSKFWLRNKVLQGDLQRPRTFHLSFLLPVPSSQDSPECHLVYSFLSLSGD